MDYLIIQIDLIKKRIELANEEESAANSNLSVRNARYRASFYKMLLGDKKLKRISDNKPSRKKINSSLYDLGYTSIPKDIEEAWLQGFNEILNNSKRKSGK